MVFSNLTPNKEIIIDNKIFRILSIESSINNYGLGENIGNIDTYVDLSLVYIGENDEDCNNVYNENDIEKIQEGGKLLEISELLANLKEGGSVEFEYKNKRREGLVRSINKDSIDIVYIENGNINEIKINRDINKEIPL